VRGAERGAFALGLWPMPLLAFGLRQAVLAGVVFAAVWGLTRLLRNRRAALHAALWSLVLVRLVLPTGLSAPWSPLRLLEGWLTPATVTGVEAAAPAWLELQRLAPTTPTAAATPSLAPPAVAVWLLLALWIGGAAYRLARFVAARRRYHRVAASAPRRPSPTSWPTWRAGTTSPSCCRRWSSPCGSSTRWRASPAAS